MFEFGVPGILVRIVRESGIIGVTCCVLMSQLPLIY